MPARSRKTTKPQTASKTKSKNTKGIVVSRADKFSFRRLSRWHVAAFTLVFAAIGGYFIYASFADTPATTGVLVGMLEEQGLAETRDASGTVHYSAQPTVFKVTTDNTLVCGDPAKPDTVTTAQLTADQVNNLATQVVNAGINRQPAEINAPGNGSRTGQYTLIIVNANGVNKQVDIYGNAQTNDFGRAVRKIGQDACKQASKEVPVEQAATSNKDAYTKPTQAQGDKVAKWVEDQVAAKAAADGYLVPEESETYVAVNAARASNGVSPQLVAATCLRDRARWWSTQMAATNTMYHGPLASTVVQYCPVSTIWHTMAENVGWSSCTSIACAKSLVDMMMAEVPPDDGHKVNILDTNSRYFGVGVYYDSVHGKMWMTNDFLSCWGTNGSCPISTYTYNNLPVGYFNNVTRAPGGIRAVGWAVDPDDPLTSINAAVYSGNGLPGGSSPGKWMLANVYRPDVASVYPSYGSYHGYNDIVAVSPGYGPQTVCVYGIDTVSGNPNLGCKSITVSPNPFGNLDSATRVTGGVHLVGWMIDPDTDNPINVSIFGGTGTVTSANSAMAYKVTTANVTRNDVHNAYPNYSAQHGFDVVVPTSTTVQTFCVYGINDNGSATGASNPVIGCRTL